MAAAARNKKLGMADMQGSTFTITNPGPFASYASAPIINQPNTGILCTDGVKRRPVAVGDAIAIHPTGIIGLVYDHRAFDGSTASLFLMHIRDSLEKRDWEAEVG
jgi:pyruvate dehydrogenase E2 component (dihydrolipoamide acetyltransferase)